MASHRRLLPLVLLAPAAALVVRTPQLSASSPLLHHGSNAGQPTFVSASPRLHHTSNAPRRAVVSALLPPSTLALTILRGGGALPTVPALVAASFLPTCLGFWRSGYAVSYGYGGAMLAAGVLMLRSGSVGTLAAAHALALCFYGARLNAFLLYRELSLPEAVHQMKRRDASLGARLKRAPVVIGCSALYFCMAAPLRVTARATALGPVGTAATAVAIALAFAGFGLAAVGDVWKTVVKARKGANHLVISGPFARLRHPNYTGECFGWTASFGAALVAAACGGGGPDAAAWLVGSALGWAGILFVLAGEATAGLEKKQREKYGGRAPDYEYEAWLARTWAGPMMPGAA